MPKYKNNILEKKTINFPKVNNIDCVKTSLTQCTTFYQSFKSFTKKSKAGKKRARPSCMNLAFLLSFSGLFKGLSVKFPLNRLCARLPRTSLKRFQVIRAQQIPTGRRTCFFKKAQQKRRNFSRCVPRLHLIKRKDTKRKSRHRLRDAC